jgi:hypothetical protein
MSGGSSEKLLLQQTSNPLRRKVDLPNPLPKDFTENFIASFSEPITPETRLMDKQNTGWLVWGDSLEYYVLPSDKEEPLEWDTSSTETIETLREIIIQAGWWETFIKHLAMEKTVDVSFSSLLELFVMRDTHATPSCSISLPMSSPSSSRSSKFSKMHLANSYFQLSLNSSPTKKIVTSNVQLEN